MLQWLGERHDSAAALEAGNTLAAAVDAAFAAGGLVTCELGGDAGTAAVTDAVLEAIAAGMRPELVAP
jgi:3-isopropylmalate dehydrogenase